MLRRAVKKIKHLFLTAKLAAKASSMYGTGYFNVLSRTLTLCRERQFAPDEAFRLGLFNPGRHTNCCRCEKCIRTILSFRAAGVPLPSALSRDVTNHEIRCVHFHQEQNPEHWLEIARGAESRGFGSADWVRAIYAAIRCNERRRRWRWLRQALLPLRNRIRRIFRGSPLSRKELAARARRMERAPDSSS